jgi:hypothetical protein
MAAVRRPKATEVAVRPQDGELICMVQETRQSKDAIAFPQPAERISIRDDAKLESGEKIHIVTLHSHIIQLAPICQVRVTVPHHVVECKVCRRTLPQESAGMNESAARSRT